MYDTSNNRPTPRILNVSRPNIVLIIWESLTAKAVESLGGLSGVTPEFHALEREGILFSRCYASGSRSGDGLVAVLSGYPAQSGYHIIKNPRKTAKLPSLGKSLRTASYRCSFYYGGDLGFDSMQSYLTIGGFERIIGKDSFPSSDWTSKWGVYDHTVKNRFLRDIGMEPQPFFAVWYTLSSHEPFAVPSSERNYPGPDGDSRFLRSLHYTDRVVGDFVRELKKTPWYHNTLIIIIADHGTLRLGNTLNHDPLKYHIPMLWTGGALSIPDSVETKVCSQTDLAATLLQQLDMGTADYRWSKDILNPRTPAFAEYVFKFGMGYVTERGTVIFNNASKTLIRMDSTLTDRDVRIGKAILQTSFQDMMDK